MKKNVKFYVQEKDLDGELFISNNLEDCVKFIEKLRKRDKKDGYDEFWHTIELEIIEETTYNFVEKDVVKEM